MTDYISKYAKIEYIIIPLTQGKEAWVSVEDVDLVKYKWRCSTFDYAIRSIRVNGKVRNIYMHRTILERAINRPMEPHEITDHKDNNSLDNRRSNLRLADKSTNSMNSIRHNSSGYKGVSLHKRDNLYRARITVNRKEICLGYYKNPKDAYKAYCEANAKYHGEFGRIK